MEEVADALLVVAKRDCPTCTLIRSVYREIAAADETFTVFSQDDPGFPEDLERVVDDSALEYSYRLDIETVPTLIKRAGGREVGRAVGWNREEWEALSGVDGLGAGLPEHRPGCGSRSVEPGRQEWLELRYGTPPMRARSIELGELEDAHEACYERGWSDGLPVVPPTPVRVLRMLRGTTRAADEIIGRIPPNLAECSVEKVAVNAVMAGCRPEYLPVVLTAVEAALEPAFCMHGLLCTTYFSGPVVVVNGPVARRIGMNWGGNALGQGNRANATIGRALQLVIRNVGGGVPGGIDRATLGTPGKYTFCFAEDETDAEWVPLSVAQGFDSAASTVTLFGGDGVLGNFDQLSRSPESLTRSLAMSLQAVGHPKKMQSHDALLVLSPEHYRIYRSAGWDRARIESALGVALTRPGRDLVQGALGVAEGMPETCADQTMTKFRPGGLNLVRAGGSAGLMSAIIGGWAATGERGSEPVTKEISS